MIWQTLYNQWLLAGYNGTNASLYPWVTSLTTDRVIFDGYSLDSSYIRIQQPNYDDIGDVDLKTFDAPRVDGGGVLGHYYRWKDLTFRLSIRGATASELNDRIDELKKRTRKTEWLLEVLVNGEYRVCEASITSLKFNREYYHITFVKDVEISFRTMSPHRRAKDDLSLTYNGVTSDLIYSIDNTWSVETDVRIYMVFSSATVTGLTSIAYTTWGYTLTITQNFSANDVLIIDSIEKEVTLNGTIIDYTGKLPSFDVWNQSATIDFTNWATYNCTITTIYRKPYK